MHFTDVGDSEGSVEQVLGAQSSTVGFIDDSGKVSMNVVDGFILAVLDVGDNETLG